MRFYLKIVDLGKFTGRPKKPGNLNVCQCKKGIVSADLSDPEWEPADEVDGDDGEDQFGDFPMTPLPVPGSLT